MFETNETRQLEIEKLMLALEELPIGGVLDYLAVSEILGRKVTHMPFVLMRAREKTEKKTGLRFSTVRTVGLKKMSGTDIASIGKVARTAIAHKASKHSKRLSSLKYNNIDKHTQTSIDAERSLLAAISVMAKADSANIEEGTKTGPMLPRQVFNVVEKEEEE